MKPSFRLPIRNGITNSTLASNTSACKEVLSEEDSWDRIILSVLVTHAHNRLAYYATRNLSQHGIEVTCASDFPLAASFFSRYCSSHFTYPSPWKYPDLFIEKVIEEIEKQGIEVLMPVHREGYVLARYKDKLDRYVKFPCSPYSKMVLVNDKRRLIDIAKETKVRIPKTITPSSLEEVKETSSDLKFPAVIKLSQGHGDIGMSIVNDSSELFTKYCNTLQKFNLSIKEKYPIIQEFIQGKTIESGMLFNDGRLKAEFSSINPIHPPRRHFHRVEYGEPGHTQPLLKLAKYLNWHGMIAGSIIIEESTDLAHLVDVNPRFDGALGHAIISGVEFPYLLYSLAINRDVDPCLEFKRGLEARWFWGDLSNIPKFMVRGELDRVVGILTCRTHLDFWESSDPVPFFIIPIYYLTQLLRYGTLQPLVEKYWE